MLRGTCPTLALSAPIPEVVLHGRRARNKQTLLWVKGFTAVASVASKARLRFLASTTMNGCVTAHHASHVKSAVLGDGITRDADWVAHAWRGNSLSTLRRVGHKVAAMAASFHRSEETYERHCKMEVDSSFAFRLSHVIDLASFKALGPVETLPFQQSRRRVSGSWSACPWPERTGP